MIQDRYLDSSWPTKAPGACSTPRPCAAISEWAIEGLTPDLTILLDLDADAARAASTKRAPGTTDSRRGIEFHDRVRAAYLELAEARAGSFPRRRRVADRSTRSPGRSGPRSRRSSEDRLDAAVGGGRCVGS